MRLHWSVYIVSGLVMLGGSLALWWPEFAGTRGAEAIERQISSTPFVPNTRSWQAFLDEVVDDEGNVDYEKAQGPIKQQLQLWLDQVARATPSLFESDDQRLAFYINAYNALVISGVLRYWPINSVDEAGALHKFFRERAYVVAGVQVSLHGFETQVIRQYDPRLHFALNCASASCPPLSARAYSAGELDSQLEAATARFIGDLSRNMYDDMTQTWYLSKIFEWYEADFGGEDGVRALLKKHAPTPVFDEAQIIFLEYDWGLNKRVTAARLN